MTDKRARVMVVEDVESIRAGMKKVLERYGYRVVVATDDEEAVEVAERQIPDLILTEEEVPTLDRLTERLSRHPLLSKVPVVIVNPDEEEGTRYGDVVVLPNYDRLAHLLAGPRR